jgi:hypothetical protein
MTLNELASWSTIIQTVFVVISLIFIWRQLRQSTELAKASNVQALVEQAGSFNSMLIQDKEIAQLWYSHGKKFKSVSDTQRYRELMVQWLIFHENVYYQYNNGLLDRRLYQAWREELKYFVHVQNLGVVTNDFELFFPNGFGKHIIELRKEQFNSDFQPDLTSIATKRK